MSVITCRYPSRTTGAVKRGAANNATGSGIWICGILRCPSPFELGRSLIERQDSILNPQYRRDGQYIAPHFHHHTSQTKSQPHTSLLRFQQTKSTPATHTQKFLTPSCLRHRIQAPRSGPLHAPRLHQNPASPRRIRHQTACDATSPKLRGTRRWTI